MKWKARANESSDYIVDEEGIVIFVVPAGAYYPNFEEGREEIQRKCRLVVSAPDLLAEIKQLKQIVINEQYAARLEAENASILEVRVNALRTALKIADAALRYHPGGDNRSVEDIEQARAALGAERG